MTAISAAEVEHYREHGWISPIDVMSESEAADLLHRLEQAESTHPDQLHAEHRNNAHLAFPFLAALAVDERIVDAVVPIVGPDISLWSTVLFIKEANSGSYVSWHQDGFYMGLEPDNFVTAWVALSPSNRETGCVAVLPGTHHSAAEHHDTFDEENILTRGQTVTAVDESRAVDLVLRPGQMSLHHPWLVHGSQPNTSDQRRVGVAMQSYLGADVRPIRGAHHVLPVRGQQPDPAFVTVTAPASDGDAVAVRTRRAANEALSSVLYDGAEHIRKL